MKKISFLFVCIFLFQPISAQISGVIPSSISIAQTSVAETHNWSAFNNPSMLGYLQNPELAIQFENRFIIPELSTKSIQFGYPTKIVNVGFSYSYFGYSLYHEMLINLSFARNFSDKFSMGMDFIYYNAYFNASNSYHGALLPQVGLSVHLSQKFVIGFNTFNPFQMNIQTEYSIKRIPSVFSLGSAYFFSPELVWRTQIDKEISSNYRFATGFEYQMIESMAIKMGAYGYDYLVPCLGFGLKTGAFHVDLNCELHPLLGLNSIISVRYQFVKK